MEINVFIFRRQFVTYHLMRLIFVSPLLRYKSSYPFLNKILTIISCLWKQRSYRTTTHRLAFFIDSALFLYVNFVEFWLKTSLNIPVIALLICLRLGLSLQNFHWLSLILLWAGFESFFKSRFCLGDNWILCDWNGRLCTLKENLDC